jgi:hypothetical protein
MRLKDGRQQPFVWFPPELLPHFGAQMKPHGLAVYMSLLTHLNRKQGCCYLAHDTIATETGMSVAQVKVSLKTLATLRLIGITMRRPKVNIYEVFDLPDIPVNSQDMPIDTPEPNSQEVAINSQEVAINSQDMAIEQPGGSYEPEVFVPEVHNQKTTTTTTGDGESRVMAPTLTDVVEVGVTVASAQGKEAKATDGGIGCDAPTPFDEFFDAYPTHRGREKAAAQWDRQHLDATLPTILEALSWQTTLTGKDALPLYPHVYLQNKGWLDTRPAALSAPPRVVWDPDAPRCKVPECPDAPNKWLSEHRCDRHAREYIRRQAEELCAIIVHERPLDLKARLRNVFSACQPTHADRFMAGINWDWPEMTVDGLAQAIEHVQVQVMADTRILRNIPSAAENILAVIEAQRQWGGLEDPEKMIKRILEERHLPADVVSWKAWLRGGEIPTVEALGDMIREAMIQEVSA